MNLDEFKSWLSELEAPVVVVPIGASGSGKSTLCQKLSETREDIVVLSSDSTRELFTGNPSNLKVSWRVFKHLYEVVNLRSQHKQCSIFDATSVKPSDRKKIIKNAREHRRLTKVIGILVDTDLKTCKERQFLRDRRVPEFAIEKQHHNFENTKHQIVREKFDEVYLYDTEEDVMETVELEKAQEPVLDISNTLTAFNKEVIGSKVIKPVSFLNKLKQAVINTDFDAQRCKGQAYIPLDEAKDSVSCGVGKAVEDPEAYVIRKYRGDVHLYLKRDYAAKTSNLAVVVYTKEAYVKDPDVQKDKAELERAKDSEATHFIVAVLASAGQPSPMSPSRFVSNLAGGNNEALDWTADEIRQKAREIHKYYANENWKTVAD